MATSNGSSAFDCAEVPSISNDRGERIRASWAIIVSFLLYGTCVDASVAIRVLDTSVHQVQEVGDEAWLATKSGAYRIDGLEVVPVLSDIEVRTVAEVEGQVWLGTDQGLYRARNTSATPLAPDLLSGKRVNAIQLDERGVVWIGTEDAGLVLLDSADPSSPLPLPPAFPSSARRIDVLLEIGGALWLSTNRGAFRFATAQAPPFHIPDDGDRLAVFEVGAETWICRFSRATGMPLRGHCARVEGTRLEPVAGLEDLAVADVIAIDGVPWLATTDGLFRLDGSVARSYGGLDEAISAIDELRGDLWLTTGHQSYVRREDGFYPVPEAPIQLADFADAGGHVWLWGRAGAFRFDEDVDLALQPRSATICGIEIIVGSAADAGHLLYLRDGRVAYPGRPAPAFETILATDRETFVELLEEKDTELSPSRTTVEVGRLPTSLHAFVRDSSGNELELPARTVFAIPTWVAVGVFVWALFVTYLLTAAPWFETAMDGLMITPLRWAGSLFLIPILLSFSSVRRHLLRRYRRAVRSRCQSDRLVGTTHEKAIGEVLRCLFRHRRIALRGDREITREYLAALCRRLAWRDIPQHEFGAFLPLYLRLEVWAPDDKLIEGTAAMLDDLGGITDAGLARRFLRRGGFAFLLRGWSTEDAGIRRRVERFVASNRSRNLFVVTCEDGCPALEGFHIVDIPVAIASEHT